MTRSSASSTAVLNAAATVRQFYEPLARDETRRAVERWRSAKQRHAQAAAAAAEAQQVLKGGSPPVDRLDAFKAALHREYRAAEAHLVRLLVAWDPDALDMDADNAERQYWPPRGAIVDGVLYVACPIDPDECQGMAPGESSMDGAWVIQLQVIPLTALVNLDADELDTPPATGRPEKRAIHERPKDPYRIVEGDDGNVSETEAGSLAEVIDAELAEMAEIGAEARERAIYHRGALVAVLRKRANGMPTVTRFD